MNIKNINIYTFSPSIFVSLTDWNVNYNNSKCHIHNNDLYRCVNSSHVCNVHSRCGGRILMIEGKGIDGEIVHSLCPLRR